MSPAGFEPTDSWARGYSVKRLAKNRSEGLRLNLWMNYNVDMTFIPVFEIRQLSPFDRHNEGAIVSSGAYDGAS